MEKFKHSQSHSFHFNQKSARVLFQKQNVNVDPLHICETTYHFVIFITTLGKSSRHDKKWRKRGDGIRANMTQYNLASNYIDVLVADASLHQLWRQQTLFDTIITDRKLRNRFLGSRVFLR